MYTLTFAQQIVTGAWNYARLIAEDPTIDSLINAAETVVGQLRTGIQKRSIVTPMRIGLAGVLLPDDVDQIDLGWGVIRKTDSRDQRFVSFAPLEGKLSTNIDDRQIVMNYSGDLVLETDIPLHVMFRKDNNSFPEWPEELRKPQRDIDEMLENIRLGLLLAFPDKRAVIIPTWQHIFDPFASGSSFGWTDSKQTVGLHPRELSTDDVDQWKNWIQRIRDHRQKSTSVAMRRILMCVSERRRAEDVLVDAVIVWENLFGAKNDTTLRVSSSLAWLLGTSPADRLERQRQYKNIYQLRSDIVHGSASIKDKVVQSSSTEAVAISIAALRKIFDEKPYLLTIDDSALRSLHLIHNVEPTDVAQES